ncbi:MAG: acyl-CoA thioesterase [Bacteroidetes bacterium]|nr:acyl-CoA thioesterase [Bacteroidota bacterium]
MNPRKVSDSLTIMTELVIPNDTNVLGNLRGGRLLHWMDVCSAISAGKHSNRVVVTASVDTVSFEHPIALGDVVTIKAQVTRAFTTSMEVYIEVWSEHLSNQDGQPNSGNKVKSNEAYYTFVALDDDGKPVKVPASETESETEQKRFDGALERREMRLKFKNS